MSRTGQALGAATVIYRQGTVPITAPGATGDGERLRAFLKEGLDAGPAVNETKGIGIEG